MERQQIARIPLFQNTSTCPPSNYGEKTIPSPIYGQIIGGIRDAQPFFESKDIAKKYLEDRITLRRNKFIKEYRDGFHGSAVLTYEPALDREVYKELSLYRLGHIDAYKEVLRGLNAYTKFQVETFIGERLNVGLSKFEFDLKFDNNNSGVIYGQKMDVPLIQMIERGRDCRNEVGTEIDLPRQQAEVTQFEKIQEVMGNPQAEIGTTIVSFSPPGKDGSSYAHNFYDVFILKEKDSISYSGESKKEKYIEARRYASGLSIKDSLKKAEELQPGYTQKLQPEEQNVDAFFISSPIILTSESKFFNDPEKVHQELQGDKKAMSYEKFQEKIVKDETFSQMVDYYIQTLEENPEDTRILKRTLDAIMNRADEMAGLKKETAYSYARERRNGPISPPLPIMAQINHYGMQEVRKTDTGCGLSGGFGQESRFSGYGANRIPGNMSPTKSATVASGEDKYGKRTFECPECKQTNVRPYDELLPNCQFCGTDKVAC